MNRSLRLALLTIVAVPGPLAAQQFWVAGVGAHATRQAPAVTLSGVLLGGTGGVAWGPMGLEAGYTEGRLKPDDGSSERPVLVEAFAGVLVRPIGGLAVGAGPYARAHVTDADVRRWLFWRIRGRYEVPLVPRRLAGYAEFWSSVAGSGADTPDAARGGGAGLILDVAPLVLRLSYTIDDARLNAAAGHETLERLTLAVGVGRP